jgi:hypothetical protein
VIYPDVVKVGGLQNQGAGGDVRLLRNGPGAEFLRLAALSPG